MTRLRVLRVIARMNVGGPALQVVALTRGLSSARFDTRLLVGRVDEGEADYLELRAPDLDNFTRVPGLGRAPNVLADARAFRHVVQEIRSFRPHIVHTHTAKAGVIGRLAARLCRVPATVHTFHGHLLTGYFSPAVTRAVVGTERSLAHLTTRLVAVGTNVRDELLAARIGKPGQYAVVPPGVELPPAPSRDEARAALGLPPHVPVVVYVARLTAVKRPDRFVEVAQLVGARRPDTVFVVGGEGALLEPTRSSARPLGEQVRFLGWRSDVEVLYAAADVVLLTSDNEGMPVSLIEAASVGRPAVTTDVGSAGEVVLDGVTGCVRPLAPEALAEAVELLLADAPLRHRMGAAAADHAHRRFGAHRLVADMERLYEEIAGQKGLG